MNANWLFNDWDLRRDDRITHSTVANISNKLCHRICEKIVELGLKTNLQCCFRKFSILFAAAMPWVGRGGCTPYIRMIVYF